MYTKRSVFFSIYKMIINLRYVTHKVDVKILILCFNNVDCILSKFFQAEVKENSFYYK